MPFGITGMYCFGLKMPGRDKPLMRKRTRLRGTSRVLKHCAKKCPGTHTHRHVIGGFKISGKWMNVCDFSGGYTQQFAHAVLDGAEAYLEEGPEPEVLVKGRQVEEEQFQDMGRHGMTWDDMGCLTWDDIENPMTIPLQSHDRS